MSHEPRPLRCPFCGGRIKPRYSALLDRYVVVHLEGPCLLHDVRITYKARDMVEARYIL